eukprot:gene17025-13749_t
MLLNTTHTGESAWFARGILRPEMAMTLHGTPPPPRTQVAMLFFNVPALCGGGSRIAARDRQ